MIGEKVMVGVGTECRCSIMSQVLLLLAAGSRRDLPSPQWWCSLLTAKALCYTLLLSSLRLFV